MHIVVQRQTYGSDATIGELSIGGELICYTLEDTVRKLGADGKAKVYGKTAIPAGKYKVIVNMSHRFKKRMPLLLDVPHFAGIRIHSGNTAEDTEGCILVGMAKVNNAAIGHSRVAFNLLLSKIDSSPDPITIEIRDL